MKNQENNLLKRFLKRKKKITEALIVTFLITGGVASQEVEGAFSGSCTLETDILTCTSSGGRISFNSTMGTSYKDIFVSNASGQTITANNGIGIDGIAVVDNKFYIKNDGTIKATGGTGIDTTRGLGIRVLAHSQGGVNDLTITNSEGSTINGERTGINIDGNFQEINGNNIFGKITINNAGSITSSYRTALYLEKLTGDLVDINVTNSATGIIKSENSADSRTGADGLKVYFDNGSSGDINVTNHGTIEGGRGMKVAPRTIDEEWLGNINIENTGIVRGNISSSIHLASSGNEATGYTTLSNSGTLYGTVFIGSNANNGGGDISIFNTGTIHNNVNMDDGGDIVLKSIGNMEGSLSFDVGIIEDTTKILETLIEIDNIKGTITDYALASRSRDSNVVIKGSITGNVKLRGGNDNLTFRDNDATTLTINGINQTGSNRVTNLGTGNFDGGDGIDTLTFDGFGHKVDNILIGWEEIIVKNTDTSALTSGGIASSGLDINFQNEIRTDTLTIDSGGIAFIDTPISINQTNTPTNLGNLVIKDSQSSGGGTLVVDAQSLAGASALTANSATLSGNLDVINFNSGSNFTNVSGVLNSGTISAIKTTENITTNFDSVSISGENFNLDGIDYLIGGSEIVGGTDYRVGVTLAWDAPFVGTAGSAAHGTFTVTGGDTFNIDVENALSRRSGTFTSGWDGNTLTKEGTGTLSMTKVQDFNGVINVNAGVLELSETDDILVKNSTVKVDGTLDIVGTKQTLNNISGAGTGKINISRVTNGDGTFTDSTLVANSNTSTKFDGVISGDGAFIKTGNGATTFTSAHTFTGTTDIKAGSINVEVADVFKSSSDINVDGKISVASVGNTEDRSQTLNNLTGAATGKITGANTTVVSNKDTTFDGAIYSIQDLYKDGTGSLTLTGKNSNINNGAHINKGTLILDSASDTADTLNTNVEVNEGGTLKTLDNQNIFSLAGAGKVILDNNSELTLTKDVIKEFSGTISNGFLADGTTASTGKLSLADGTLTLSNKNIHTNTDISSGAKLIITNLDGVGVGTLNNQGIFEIGVAGDFDNNISGKGTININSANKTDVVSFSGTNTADLRDIDIMKGTMNIGGSSGADKTTALIESANLSIQSDGVLNVATNSSANNLNIAGGQIDLAGDSTLTVADLKASGGSIVVDNSRFTVDTGGQTIDSNLLDQDEGEAGEIFVEATGKVDETSVGVQLDLIDRATGNEIAATLKSDLNQNGTTIGTAYIGQTGAIVSTGNVNGIASSVALTRIDINNEESVVFDSRGATDNVFTAQITGAGGVTVDTGEGNKVVLKRDNNSFSGRTAITSGTLEIGNSGVLGNSAGVDIAIDATLDLATYDITLKGIMGRGTIDLKGQTLTIADDAEVSLFGGYIIGEGNLVKSGTNFLQFSSSTSFTGTTTVNGGELRLASTPGNTLASTSVTIGEAGTVILGASEVLNDVSGTGSIELVGRHLTFNNDEATEFNGVVKDTGLISKSGTETLSLGGDIGTGTFNIDAGRVKLTTDTAAGTREVTNDSELELSFTNGTLANNISNTEAGVGDVFVTGTGIAVRGDNTNFDGTWQISGDMNVTEAKHLGAATIGFATPAVPGTAQGVLKVTGMGMNILGGVDGEGIIDINLANIENRLDFTNGGNATGNFTGDMNLSSGTLVMSKDTASTLASGTINVNSGAMVEVSSDQSTGDVVLNGGKMLFTNNSNPLDIDGTLSVTSFDATGGGALELDTSTLTLSTEALNSSMSLLDTDNIIDERVVSTTGTVSGQGQIDILELGTLQGVQSNRDILDANNQKVADAIFDITGVVDAEGVGVGFNLAEVNILPGKTLELNSVGAVDTTLGAKLTGTGDLNVSGTSASDVITLANTDNDFSGKTSVTMGTLALGQDNSLGKTSEVLLNAGTTLDVNGVTQGSEINVLNAGNGSSVKLNDGTLSVKNLVTSSSSVLDFGQTGTMNISGGGELKGDNILSGSGVLNLTDQSILTMDGNNTNSNIGVNVDEAAMLMVQGSLGGSIVNRGMVGFGEKTTRAGSASNFRVTGDFTNSGTLDLTTSSAVNDVMTVNGDFVASPNSTIIFDINSSTNGTGANDKLVVGGSFTGTSEIDLVSSTGQAYGSLANLADASEALVTNFELISASSMNGTLTLAMSDRFAGYSNLARLTGSPFVWKLATDADSANLVVATPGDAGSNNGGGNIDFGVIDLRPSPVVAAPPVILGPEVGAFRSLATSSNEMISDSVKGLHNRLGELRANEKDSERDYDYLLNRENSGFAAWSKGSTVGMDVDGFYDGSFGGVDLGVDYMWDDLGEADILTGAYVGYRHGSFDSDGSESMGVEGNIDTSTLHFGLYTTLFYKGSWYTDLVMQYGHIDSDITADQLTDTVHGNAFTGSVETGYSYNVTENWLIEPQAQVTTSIIDLDNSTFNDTRVDFDSETFVTGRVGARTEYEFDMPKNIKVKPYAKASGLYEFADREEVEYAGLELEGHEFSAGMETGAGLTIQVEDYFSIYGEFDYTTDFDEYDQYKGSFGARYSF